MQLLYRLVYDVTASRYNSIFYSIFYFFLRIREALEKEPFLLATLQIVYNTTTEQRIRPCSLSMKSFSYNVGYAHKYLGTVGYIIVSVSTVSLAPRRAEEQYFRIFPMTDRNHLPYGNVKLWKSTPIKIHRAWFTIRRYLIHIIRI